MKGKAQPAKLYEMRFDLDGKVQKTLLTPAAAPPQKGRGMRGRIKERRVAEFKEWAGDLAELTKGYLTPSPAVLQTFFGKALLAQTPDGFVQIHAGHVVVPGDQMIYEVDPKAQALPEFAPLPDGTSYAARTTVSVPAKQVAAKIENFDYVKQ